MAKDDSSVDYSGAAAVDDVSLFCQIHMQTREVQQCCQINSLVSLFFLLVLSDFICDGMQSDTLLYSVLPFQQMFLCAFLQGETGKTATRISETPKRNHQMHGGINDTFFES